MIMVVFKGIRVWLWLFSEANAGRKASRCPPLPKGDGGKVQRWKKVETSCDIVYSTVCSQMSP